MESSQINLLDKLIAIGVVLFILSLINEKITTLVRKYTRHASEYPIIRLLFRSPPKKETKEKEIILFSIFMGVLISWLTNASLFELFKNTDPTTVLFIDPFEGHFSILKTLGILLTGFFLSFGSKFFHDLLDLLFQVKNYRRKLTDERSYRLETIRDLDDYIAIADGVVADKAIKAHEQYLKSNFNVKSIYRSDLEVNGKKKTAIVVHLKDNKSANIPKTLPYRLKSGKAIDIPIEVVKNVAIPKIQKRPGVKIANVESDGEKGAFGCVVENKTGEQFILSCSHVALFGSAENLGGLLGTPSDFTFRAFGAGRPYLIGELFYCKRDARNDTALIQPRRHDNTNETVELVIEEEREIDPNEDQGAEVFFVGSASEGLQSGQIHVAKSPHLEQLEYADDIVEFRDMIMIGRKTGNTWQSISQKGDSGSVIVDENNKAIGLLIGGNDQFTYALPIQPILKEAGVTIV